MGRQFLIVEKMIRLKRVGGKGGESFKNSNLNIRRKNEHKKKLRGGEVLWWRFRLLGINPGVEYIVVSRSVQQVYPRCGSVVGESVRVYF